MLSKNGFFQWFLFATISILVAAQQVRAEDFYKDKTIFFVVGYSPGGSFDTYTRLIARHFAKHVPGSPTTIVQNITGAGGIIAANYIYNKAKPNGLTIGAWASGLVLQNIMGNKATKFDGRKFGWLGVPSAYHSVCTFSKESGIKTVEDWFASKRPIRIGAIGPGTSTSDVPKLLKVAIGLPMQVIDGYRGGAGVRLALESGEVHGYCGSWQTLKAISRAALESGKIRMVLQTSLKSHPEIKDVPLAIHYAKTPEARQLLNVAESVYGGQFLYTVPPGTPKDRLQILQQAFMETLGDAELLAEAKRSKLEIDPIGGPTTAKTLGGLYDLDPAMKSKLKEILVPKK